MVIPHVLQKLPFRTHLQPSFPHVDGQCPKLPTARGSTWSRNQRWPAEVRVEVCNRGGFYQIFLRNIFYNILQYIGRNYTGQVLHITPLGVFQKWAPKSSILMGSFLINHPFWGTPIVGHTHFFVDLGGKFPEKNRVTRSISTHQAHQVFLCPAVQPLKNHPIYPPDS